MNLLVVDDEPAVRDALDRALRAEGYRVATAADGRAALDRMAEERPDLIVLDVLMPVMDGLEVCRALRAAGDRTPILVLTARDSVADRVEGLDAGADDYLVKPFALDELLARIRALLRRSTPGADERPLRRPGARPGDARRPPRGPHDRADADRVPPARAVPRQPAPRPHARDHLRSRLGL
jgi:two-component system, OmpR family, response regulator MprA